MIKHWFWRILNALQGCGFYYDSEGVMQFWKGTCPRPLRNDWSSRACIKAGDCGCDEQDKAAQAKATGKPE